jgi:hypothetical protein
VAVRREPQFHRIEVEPEKNVRNIPATLAALSRRERSEQKEKLIPKSICAGPRRVYESPAQIGFPGIATPLQIMAGFPEFDAVCCQAVSAASRKSSLAWQSS